MRPGINSSMARSVITSAREKAGNLWLEYLSRRRKNRINRLTDPSTFGHLKPAIQVKSKWYGTSYGGFYIVSSLLDRSSVIYSFGTGRDISFDLECIRKHGASVFAFDPTPVSIDWIGNRKLPDRFHFHPYGISASGTGEADFFLPANPRAVSGSLIKHREVDAAKSVKVMMKTFDDITRELGHNHVDVLKMDIEGSEYDVIDTILASPVTIDQILVEFHDRDFEQAEPRSGEAIRKLSGKGYLVYGCSGSYEEVSLIHESKIKSLMSL
jgi:FkbM family methyltransferase